MSCSIIVMGASGRMGTTIVQLAKEQGFTLAGVVERSERLDTVRSLGVPCSSDPDDVFKQCPGAVVVDFTTPEATLHTVQAALRHHNPMVIGTTGFTDTQKAELTNVAQRLPLFWAPNMSIGVYAILEILPKLVQILGSEFDMDVLEMHHNRKKDAPSGTALRIAECLAAARDWKLSEVANFHREGIIGERPAKEIGLQTLRGGDVAGVHTVYFMGQGERIEVTHQAHSRTNFAQGALRAAAWLTTQKPGTLYSMADLFA